MTQLDKKVREFLSDTASTDEFAQEIEREWTEAMSKLRDLHPRIHVLRDQIRHRLAVVEAMLEQADKYVEVAAKAEAGRRLGGDKMFSFKRPTR